jgi:calmodulin
MEELSEEQIEEFKEAFSLFDPEGHEYIYTKELGTVLRSLGIHTTDEEKNEFIEKFDSSSDGFIYFKDFLEIIISKIAETKPEDELLEAFKLFDSDKKNYLEVDAFKADLATYCPGIDQNEINDICDFLKINNNTNLIEIDGAVQKLFSKVKNHLN